MSPLALFTAVSFSVPLAVHDDALRVMVEAAASSQDTRTRIVCAALEGRDPSSAQLGGTQLSFDRAFQAGSACDYKHPYFVHVPSGENAIRIDFTDITLAPDHVTASFRARATDFDCSGDVSALLGKDGWTATTGETLSCVVE